MERRLASRLTSLSQEPRVLLSAAGPALLNCALSLLQCADSVSVVDPVLKDECHRIETWCSEFVRRVLRPLIPPKKARPPFDGVASLVVDRGAGTGLGPKLWSSPAWVL